MMRCSNWYATTIFLLIAVLMSTRCEAQNYGGFRSYSNQGNYNAPMGGTQTYNSFNSGFSSFSQPAHRTYSTSNSTAAAQRLARNVNTMWSKASPAIMAMAQQQAMYQQQEQGMYQGKQGGYQMQQGGYPAQQGGLMPSITKREMLRIFLEGGSPQSTGGGYASGPSGASTTATSTAYTNYQTAVNEERKARYAAERARNHNTDQWHRKDDANTAYYAANNANYAAQRAESAAYNGDSQARNYAGLARACANRARGNANQARYNADTMH
ncbi:MAG: hypothetical protein IT342_05765 [Candidatus Melainabacteria bacterium]|nr:hypothetical protein [Candidatus Melainabacteria bacterium]